jgi:ATP-binding cassette subfamily F protein 3
MGKEEVIIRFDEVTYKYNDKKMILDEASFSIRENSKITIMGQNGAGKTTIFKLLTGKLHPESGRIHLKNNAKIGVAHQMVHKNELEKTILEYFESAFPEKVYGIEKNIKKVLEAVNLDLPYDKKIKELSGGQKARILLAFALIQDPDILLLDEPTNNLDQEGIEHLTTFLIMYPKTCLVISHDANFLNSFTDGVLNLDVFTHKVEQFVGNYYDVVEQIEAHIEKERLLNSRIEKSIKDRFEMVNKLGGKSVAMRRLANKVREDIEEDRDKMVDVRREDKTIPEFKIPYQHHKDPIIKINSVEIMREGKIITKKVDKAVARGRKLLISGPNGIGKSTLLKSFLAGKGVEIEDDVRIGYYSQDFSELNFEDTAFNALKEVMQSSMIQDLFEAAGRFMLPGELLQHKVESLSEGQKGLLCYARFMLQEPGLLIMDEPTNHINFRHIPVIAKALNEYQGALILISHLPEFVEQIKINDEINLEKLS